MSSHKQINEEAVKLGKKETLEARRTISRVLKGIVWILVLAMLTPMTFTQIEMRFLGGGDTGCSLKNERLVLPANGKGIVWKSPWKRFNFSVNAQTQVFTPDSEPHTWEAGTTVALGAWEQGSTFVWRAANGKEVTVCFK